MAGKALATDDLVVIAGALRPRCRIVLHTSVGGGCDNDAYVVEADNGLKFFIKISNKTSGGIDPKAKMDAEFIALRALAGTGTVRVPNPIGTGELDRGGGVMGLGKRKKAAFLVLEHLEMEASTEETDREFGEQLAAMHLAPTDGEGWGFFVDNTCGEGYQRNTVRSKGDWPSWFLEHRLRPQVELAKKKHGDDALASLFAALAPLVPKLFEDVVVRPSLLHGDLWSGNWGAARVPVRDAPPRLSGDSGAPDGSRAGGGGGAGYGSAGGDRGESITSGAAAAAAAKSGRTGVLARDWERRKLGSMDESPSSLGSLGDDSKREHDAVGSLGRPEGPSHGAEHGVTPTRATRLVPVVFDPASYYGHHELDLALMFMFGAPSKAFFDAYHAIIPRAPQFDRRCKLYQLYHYLNHYTIFGGGYRAQCVSIMEGLVADLGGTVHASSKARGSSPPSSIGASLRLRASR